MKATKARRCDVRILDRINARRKLNGHEVVVSQSVGGIGCGIHEPVVFMLRTPANRIGPRRATGFVVRRKPPAARQNLTSVIPSVPITLGVKNEHARGQIPTFDSAEKPPVLKIGKDCRARRDFLGVGGGEGKLQGVV